MSLGKADERDIRGIGHAELKMTFDDFQRSLTATEPPPGLAHALAGLWWDAKGDWKRAHESAQQDEGVEGSWVHAYLHRKEGDQGNAAEIVKPSGGDLYLTVRRENAVACRFMSGMGWPCGHRGLEEWNDTGAGLSVAEPNE